MRGSTCCLAVIAMMLIAVAIMPARAEKLSLEDEIKQAIETLNKSIVEGNDPMRNRMYFKFRLIEQDHPGKVAPFLIENLKSEQKGVPEYTAFILGWIADERGIDPLRQMLKGSVEFKRAASKALGNMELKAKRAVPDIIELLKDANQRVRQDAAYSLGILGDDSAIPVLEKAVKDTDELVRFFAKEAIERIENRKKYGW